MTNMNNPLTIHVLLFGNARIHAQSDRVTLTLPAPATARSVLVELAIQLPQFASTSTSARLAVNQAFASDETPVHQGDEVALISLVGGG